MKIKDKERRNLHGIRNGPEVGVGGAEEQIAELDERQEDDDVDNGEPDESAQAADYSLRELVESAVDGQVAQQLLHNKL